MEGFVQPAHSVRIVGINRNHQVQRSWRIVLQSFELRRSASSAEDSVVIEMHSMGQETVESVDMSIYDGVSDC